MSKTTEDTKHLKYEKYYKPNELFWGIGIENETYLEVPSTQVKGSFFKEHQKRERYSVDYYSGYLPGTFNKGLDTIIKNDKIYTLPTLINSFAFTKCDIYGEHSTLYTKEPCEINPAFSGETLFDTIKKQDVFFKKEYENSFCFDGDTIEFMTLGFYNTTTQKVVSELIEHKKTFLKHLVGLKFNNPFKNPFKNATYPKENYGFARFTSSMDKLAIFNNGTYHFNFTLPTQLDSNAKISNWKDFEYRHKKAIRLIQFFEPFFIAELGSSDPLTKTLTKTFPKGSQRIAASRYISAGTYNTNTMIKGKLLQEDRETIITRYKPYFWYNQLYSQINYKKGEKIGFDINFNKFTNHGIEIRFFDWFPESRLNEVLEFLVHMLDLSEEIDMISEPQDSKIWNDILYRAILEGSDLTITNSEIIYIKNILQIYTIPLKFNENINNHSVYLWLVKSLHKKFGYKGVCSSVMLEKPNIVKKLFNCF